MMIRKTALAVAVAVALGAPFAYGQSAHEHDHGATEAKLVLNQGKKWPTDAPLRQGMENIRGAVAKNVPAIHAGKATPKQYQALANKVNAEVAGIVQNCKLEPEAAHHHPCDSWHYVLEGSVMLHSPALEKPVLLRGGDKVLIPRGCRHAIEVPDFAVLINALADPSMGMGPPKLH